MTHSLFYGLCNICVEKQLDEWMNYVGFRLSVVMATLHNVKHKRNLGMRVKVEKQVGELNEEKKVVHQ